MMTFTKDNPQSCGIVETDNLGIVAAYYQKVLQPASSRANVAIYVLVPSFFEAENLDCEKLQVTSWDIIPWLMGGIFTHHVSNPIIEIGTIKKLKDAE